MAGYDRNILANTEQPVDSGLPDQPGDLLVRVVPAAPRSARMSERIKGAAGMVMLPMEVSRAAVKGGQVGCGCH